ncbi:hypothetical protein M7982_23645 [Enterobacter hormaechei subsp. xiangfangensis]|uniref:hypothetical protein n=1 Tax=Enterobacter hormaechei TaxID=158836 RepID=UPI002236108A|nr:hypothetical protein [Enterobacter hormaechei]MCW4687921.1 hypothetical protein [Enterobacter hormaechei subsp. xiangfangensis]MCW4789542.1 hypothetical protein [Enterobacter hormaechei subsp. xiangfangensis]MCW4817895.1 hypothetical protein [Enterobacter hormaechei subsp. xiangfangensis]MCW4939251.1 hypothetical protein [Enterobacter hormaechei subsp. xiangfangensis]MCW5036688.1 hypothetical protein [Enterobacter hormaechei subsp. xiangfangensis]
MSELTKEWLLKTIAELEEERDATPGAVNEDAGNALAAMKLALASIEAEPVSVQDERYQHLSEIYHAQEKRLFKLAQRIKGESFDKYSHSPSQAIDVLESAIFGESAEEDSRAAMLQGADGNIGKPLTIKLPDISSKAFWSGTGKNETFHPETYRRWVKEAIETSCTIARVDVEVK